MGDWDVVSFDDFEPVRLGYDGKRSAFFNVREDFISFSIACNHAGIAALLNEEKRLVKNPDGLSAGATVMGCRHLAIEEDFFKMMYDEPLVEILNSGGLRLTTTEHQLILERSEIRRKVNAPRQLDEIAGEWNVAWVQANDGVGYSGSTHAPQKVQIDHQAIIYGDCSPMAGRPDISSEATLMAGPIRPLYIKGKEPCQDNTEAEETVIKIFLILPEIEWTMIGDLRLRKGSEFVILTKDANW